MGPTTKAGRHWEHTSRWPGGHPSVGGPSVVEARAMVEAAVPAVAEAAGAAEQAANATKGPAVAGAAGAAEQAANATEVGGQTLPPTRRQRTCLARVTTGPGPEPSTRPSWGWVYVWEQPTSRKFWQRLRFWFRPVTCSSASLRLITASRQQVMQDVFSIKRRCPPQLSTWRVGRVSYPSSRRRGCRTSSFSVVTVLRRRDDRRMRQG